MSADVWRHGEKGCKAAENGGGNAFHLHADEDGLKMNPNFGLGLGGLGSAPGAGFANETREPKRYGRATFSTT